MASREDEQMVQALVADCADEAFREGVRSWGTHWRTDGLDADRREHVIEAGGELGVSIADEEPHPPSDLFELRGEVASGLGDPRPVGVGGDAEQVQTRRSISMTNST